MYSSKVHLDIVQSFFMSLLKQFAIAYYTDTTAYDEWTSTEQIHIVKNKAK